MPTFDTPTPITAILALVAADVTVIATDRSDTVVAVHPQEPDRKADVRMVEQTQVEFSNGRLTIKSPKQLAVKFGKPGVINVTIELPAGSAVQGDSGMGQLNCNGRLGDVAYKTGYGDLRVETAASAQLGSGFGAIHLQHAGTARLSTGGGDITVDDASGDAQVSTSVGVLRVRRVDGRATVKNSSGETWIGEVTGALSASSAAGSITIDRSQSDVTAKTAYGAIRVGEATRGELVLETSAGELSVGVPQGTAAWLDVNSSFGRIRNTLEASDDPGQAGNVVKVRARTHAGDIVIHRS
jgi:DUF4097 and DUF4098 domain-containing protein YvlB